MLPNTVSLQQQQIGRLFNPVDEKRRLPRFAASDLSQIEYGNQLIGCRIHNLSENGAMIEVSTYQVPDRFILVNYNTKMRMICKVVWREKLNIGVKYITIPKSFSDGFRHKSLI